MYARYIMKKPDPRVALLSIGEEDAKGKDVTREAFAALKRTSMNFVGNLESQPGRIGTQPTYTLVHQELANNTPSGSRPDDLIDRLVAGGSSTRAIAKGVCAATLGSAVTLVQ